MGARASDVIVYIEETFSFVVKFRIEKVEGDRIQVAVSSSETCVSSFGVKSRIKKAEGNRILVAVSSSETCVSIVKRKWG